MSKNDVDTLSEVKELIKTVSNKRRITEVTPIELYNLLLIAKHFVVLCEGLKEITEKYDE
jgi:hypothetical protein